MSLDCFLTTDSLLQTLQTGVLPLGVCVLYNEIFKERKNRPENQNTSNFQTSIRRNRLTRMTSSIQGQRLEHSSNSAGIGWKKNISTVRSATLIRTAELSWKIDHVKRSLHPPRIGSLLSAYNATYLIP
jgi:hypothetical protein